MRPPLLLAVDTDADGLRDVEREMLHQLLAADGRPADGEAAPVDTGPHGALATG